MVCAVSLDELRRYWIAEIGKGRMSMDEAKKVWASWRTGPKFVANHAAAADDVWLAKKLVEDLGSIAGRVYYKKYGGHLHVIFKGYAGTRKILNGTRYRATNAKVVQMGVGRAGALSRIRGGAVVTVVLVSAFRIIDYVMTDEQTLTGLIGNIATDVVKVGISAGFASAAVYVFSAAPVVASFAVGPLLVAVLVGMGVGLALDSLDSNHRITERLSEALDDAVDRARSSVRRRVERVEDAVLDAAGDAAESIIDAAIREAEEFVLRRLRNVFWVPRAAGV